MLPLVLVGSLLLTLFGLVLFLTAVFLILLILIQRGRGGGLSGAFGGMGGQSAFGSKAGDTFTFITIIVATFWITLCITGVGVMGRYSQVGGKFSRERALDEAPTTPVLTGEAIPGNDATGAAGSTPPSESGTEAAPDDTSSLGEAAKTEPNSTD